jgi:isoquinoline 1-oxidoreductase beta subunit
MSGGPYCDRRSVLRCLAGSLVLAVGLPRVRADPREPGASHGPAGWQATAVLELRADDTARLTLRRVEMGQGAHRGVLAVVSDALDLPDDRFELEQASSDPRFGLLLTGGSYTAAGAERRLRPVIAAVRLRLIDAAAARWRVPASECETDAGWVAHRATKRRIRYGALLEAAAALPEPDPVRAPPARVPGPRHEPIARHVPDVVRGRATYGIDVRRPGLVYAVLARAPHVHGRAARVDASACHAVPGFIRTVHLPGNHFPTLNHVRDAIAVVGRDTWAAMRARDRLQVAWDRGAVPAWSDAAVDARLRAALDSTGDAHERTRVDTEGRLARGDIARTLRFDAVLPAYPHLPLEPPNACAEYAAGAVTVWTGTQRQTRLHEALATEHGFDRDATRVHAPLLGGGFGRKLEVDYGIEAARLARELGRPVQVLWTRADDLACAPTRPPSAHRIVADVDARDRLVRWRHVYAAESVLLQQEPDQAKDGDWTMLLPLLGFPYAVPELDQTARPLQLGLPAAWWRGTGWTHVGVAVECAMNDIADALGVDPLTFRLEHLPPGRVLRRADGEFIDIAVDTGRLRRVLERAAARAQWTSTASSRRALACGFYDCDATYVAAVADADATGTRIEQLTIVVDCGRVLTPDVVEAQIEGSAVFALSALKGGGVRWQDGHVITTALSDVPLLTMSETPRLDIEVVESAEAVSGIGEPVVPVVLAAARSAIHRARGRTRRE